MSQAEPCGLLMPRWSAVIGDAQFGGPSAASFAGLPGNSISVSVGPPLSWSGPSLGSTCRKLLVPHEESVSIDTSPDEFGEAPPAQLFGMPPAKIVLNLPRLPGPLALPPSGLAPVAW